MNLQWFVEKRLILRLIRIKHMGLHLASSMSPLELSLYLLRHFIFKIIPALILSCSVCGCIIQAHAICLHKQEAKWNALVTEHLENTACPVPKTKSQYNYSISIKADDSKSPGSPLLAFYFQCDTLNLLCPDCTHIDLYNWINARRRGWDVLNTFDSC